MTITNLPGRGDYLMIADTIVLMENYLPPRPFDTAGAANRLRGLLIEQIDATAECAGASKGKQGVGGPITRLNP